MRSRVQGKRPRLAGDDGTAIRRVGDGHARSCCADQAKLGESRHAIVETDLRNDLPVLELEDGRSGEPHLAAGGGRERPDKKVAERGTRVGAAALPAADDVVALGNE